MFIILFGEFISINIAIVVCVVVLDHRTLSWNEPDDIKYDKDKNHIESKKRKYDEFDHDDDDDDDENNNKNYNQPPSKKIKLNGPHQLLEILQPFEVEQIATNELILKSGIHFNKHGTPWIFLIKSPLYDNKYINVVYPGFDDEYKIKVISKGKVQIFLPKETGEIQQFQHLFHKNNWKYGQSLIFTPYTPNYLVLFNQKINKRIKDEIDEDPQIQTKIMNQMEEEKKCELIVDTITPSISLKYLLEAGYINGDKKLTSIQLDELYKMMLYLNKHNKRKLSNFISNYCKIIKNGTTINLTTHFNVKKISIEKMDEFSQLLTYNKSLKLLKQQYVHKYDMISHGCFNDNDDTDDEDEDYNPNDSK